MTLPSFKCCCRLCLVFIKQKGASDEIRTGIERMFCFLQIKMLQYNTPITIKKFHMSSDLCGLVSEMGIELHPPHTACKALNMPILTPCGRNGLYVQVTKISEK